MVQALLAGTGPSETTFSAMLRAFLLAACVVAPTASIVALRRRRNATRTQPASPPDEPAATGTESAEHTNTPTMVAVIATIDRWDAPEETILVPGDALLYGRPAPPAVTEALVRDAIDRRGYRVIEVARSVTGTRLRCRSADRGG